MTTRHPTRREIIAGIAAASGALVLSSTSCPPNSSKPIPFTGEITRLTLLEASTMIRERKLSPVDLVKACLKRIEEVDPRLNAFITVTKERALKDALLAEKEIAAGRLRGPLHGIPVAIKDNIDTAGVRTTAASNVFRDRVPEKDAEVVTRLKAAGAIILGKLNLHEFGNGATAAVSAFGPVHNPWDLERITGGSSGGSAAAVAAGLCFGALGTDTGGSIRIPAGYCGVVGLNPTYGIVSNEGSIPLSSSYDRIGPIARSVSDAAVLFQALTDDKAASGFDPASPVPVSKLKVGILPTTSEYCDTPPDNDVAPVYAAAIDVIRSLVASVGDAELPMPDVDSLIEFESYRYHASRLAETPELYQPQTRESLLAGKAISEEEAERLRAGLARHRSSIRSSFQHFDLVVLPTNQTEPMKMREATDPFAPSACTAVFSTAGIPVISIPCGFTRSGLPVGLQIGGPPGSERIILALAHALEKVTIWHKRHPQI